MTVLPTYEAEALALAVLKASHAGRGPKVEFRNWIVGRAASGFNGIIWRATRGDGVDVAVKLSVVDERRRGQREFGATSLVAKQGLDVAPVPFALVADENVSALVSTWCPGDPVQPLPDPASEFWPLLVATYATIHKVDPVGLDETVDGSTPQAYLRLARAYATQAGRLGFLPVLDRLEAQVLSTPPDLGVHGLVHGDAGAANMILDDGTLRFVDWEYSGAGDPCADIAGFCTHPSHVPLSRERVTWLIEAHAEALGSPDLALRTRAFLRACLAYWCARTGTLSPHRRMQGVERPTAVGEAGRSNVYRDWFAEEIGWDRASVDTTLAVTSDA
jgi:aminoglycoside phosphotransferase (APT) family kinase protein